VNADAEHELSRFGSLSGTNLLVAAVTLWSLAPGTTGAVFHRSECNHRRADLQATARSEMPGRQGSLPAAGRLFSHDPLGQALLAQHDVQLAAGFRQPAGNAPDTRFFGANGILINQVHDSPAAAHSG
jgi:hypothetical protein